MSSGVPARRALRAYERLDAHVVLCEACEQDFCEQAADLWLQARALRRRALAARHWRTYELGLNPQRIPYHLLDECESHA